jgi:4-hydroxy-tetrahydrodipicolinate synthase
MPWTFDGMLDFDVLQRNVARLAAVPCDGIYTTDSDGEFYAVEFAEFRAFVPKFVHLMEGTDCGVQIGVTWTNTQGIIDRMKICVDCGVTAMHVGYPYWMPLNRDDVNRFWDDLAAAVPEARWIHYNTQRAHVRMTGASYLRLSARFPEQFIGTKLGTQNFVELSEIIGATPHLAHFVTDYAVVPGLMLGGRGVYSFWVNSLPRWHRRLIDCCLAHKWDEAMRMQLKFNQWECTCVEPLVEQGYLHGVIGKARCAAAGFLQDDGFTRAPYLPMPKNLVEQLSRDFQLQWREELLAEAFGNRHAN